jgi:hypothetical protein
MDWFRFYSETVVDKKINRIARETGLSFLKVFGAWTAILSLANDSPVRGILLLTESKPLTIDDVSETFHETLHETNVLLQAFIDAEMLVFENDAWIVVSWSQRQYESDTSTERVRRYREKKKNETLPERCGNVSETPQIQKQIQSTETDTIPTPATQQNTPTENKLVYDAFNRKWPGCITVRLWVY